MNAVWRAGWLALAWTTWTQLGAALPAITVDPAGCLAEPEWPQLQYALRVELAESGAQLTADGVGPAIENGAAEYGGGAPSDSNTWQLTITHCSLRSGTVEISWRSAGASVYSSQTLDLRDVPASARARVAAITLAELVRTWTAEAMIPAPEQPPYFSLARDSARNTQSLSDIAETAIAERSLASLTLQLLTSEGLSNLFPGLGFDVALALRPWLRPQLGVSYFRSEHKAAIGSATLHGFRTVALALFPVSRNRKIQVGPQLSMALLRAQGRSALGLAESADSAWMGTASVFAQHLTEIQPDWALVTGVACGHTWRAARFDAGAERAFSVRGIMLELRLGLALGL